MACHCLTLCLEALKLKNTHLHRGGSLVTRFRSVWCAVLIGLLAQVSAAQNPPKVALDTSETLFSVLTAINACGYDQELGVSHPLRSQVRAEVAKSIQSSPEAKEATQAMCQFYDERRQPDASRTLAQYISLALYLNGPSAPFSCRCCKSFMMPRDCMLSGSHVGKPIRS